MSHIPSKVMPHANTREVAEQPAAQGIGLLTWVLGGAAAVAGLVAIRWFRATV